MRNYWLCLIVLLLNPGLCYGQENAIRFNVTPMGFPPFVFSSPPSGIMYDVLIHVAQQQGLSVIAHRVAEDRVAVLLDNQKLDAHASAIEWMPTPQKYAFTDPILQVRDVVFSRKGTGFDYSSPADLFGRSIGVRTGYSYQSLTEHFASGAIHRTDSNSELYLLQLLARGRLGIAIITEHVGLWLIRENNLKPVYSISKKAIDTTDYRIVMTKKWQPFINAFNKELALIKSNGKLKEMLSKYR